MKFASYLADLTEDQLRKAYDEFKDLNDNGVLPNGIVDELRSKYRQMYSTQPSLSVIEKAVLEEIADRWYHIGE